MDADSLIVRRTAKGEVLRRLAEEIITGNLAPGTKLNVKQISERYGVSMTPVREAIDLLAAEGMIRSDAFRTASVAPLTVEEYEEIFLLRLGLEGLAHRLGAERMTQEECDRLEAVLSEMITAMERDDIPSFVERDRRFHEVIYSASRRPSLLERLMALRRNAERYSRAVLHLPAVGMETTIMTHRQLLEAARKNDGQAAERIIREDLRLSYEVFSREFESSVEEDKPEEAPRRRGSQAARNQAPA